MGETVTNGVRVFNDSTEVTTGTATIRYVSNDAGVTKWLQDDLASNTSTPNSIDVTHTTNEGFVHDFTVPESLRGLAGAFIVTDPATGADIYSETFSVSAGVSDRGHLSVHLD